MGIRFIHIKRNNFNAGEVKFMNYESRIKYIISFIVVFTFLTAISVLAVNDQVKTSEFFVGDSDVQITNQTVSKTFSIYIGDSLTGVTNPVKSTYFTVSGVYIGNGTLTFKIDNDAATEKIFTLPNVGTTPTPFEIIYKDDSNKINPTSAGSYNYTLNIIVPSGITISGLGAKITTTHRYAPATCPDGQPSNEKIKTAEFFVASFDSQISSATSSQFSIYIGDNLAGVTNPVKSAYFTVSGVYTGNGTLQLKIDSDDATAKTYTLPDVSATPTPFEIIYKDDSNKINPTSAGSYTYTLYITPSGVTISGLGAKVTISHRYKPPTCGGGFPATGELTSIVFDTGTEGAAYNSAYWKGTLGGSPPNQGKVKFKLATSDSSGGPWTYYGSDGTSCGASFWYDPGGADTPIEISCAPQYHNNQRYFRYKIQICSSSDCSTSGAYTPTVEDVVVSWSP